MKTGQSKCRELQIELATGRGNGDNSGYLHPRSLVPYCCLFASLAKRMRFQRLKQGWDRKIMPHPIADSIIICSIPRDHLNCVLRRGRDHAEKIDGLKLAAMRISH